MTIIHGHLCTRRQVAGTIMSTSSPVMLSNAPSSSSKFGLSLVAGLALLECQIGAATAQSKFPSDLVGSWCSINYEGEGIETELRRRLTALEQATEEVSKLRGAVSRAFMEKVQSRMHELLENADEDRILQEAAILAERSDIQEELVRLHTHIDHFRKLLDQGGEVGKKLDFLLQELNREANTLLSKTSGVAGEGLRITELGLQMKAEIEKCREQVQNLE